MRGMWRDHCICVCVCERMHAYLCAVANNTTNTIFRRFETPYINVLKRFKNPCLHAIYQRFKCHILMHQSVSERHVSTPYIDVLKHHIFNVSKRFKPSCLEPHFDAICIYPHIHRGAYICMYIYIYIHTYIHTIIVQHVLNITMCNKIHGTLQFQMQPFSNAFKRAHVPSYPNRVSRSDVFQRFQTHTHTRSYLHVQIAFPDLTFSNVSKRVMSNTTNATAASL
jgi:hypothetical protein